VSRENCGGNGRPLAGVMPRHEADFVAVMRRKRNLDGEVQCRRGPQSNPTPPSKSQSVDPMAFPGDQPVASRQSYTVTDGRRSSPDRPDRVHRDHRDHPAQGRPRRRLAGDGAATSGTIRFHQKDPGPDDKDIRVWTIPTTAATRSSPSPPQTSKATDRPVLVSGVTDRRGRSARSSCAGFLYQGL